MKQTSKVNFRYHQFEELKTLVKQHSLAYSSLQIYAQINSFQKTISELPKVLPVEHHHYFTDKSKGFMIGGMALLLISALTVGLSLSLYRENTRMKENDIKFRMIRQSYPNAAIWADTTYYSNSEFAERFVKKLKAEQLRSKKAKTANRKQDKEASIAKPR